MNWTFSQLRSKPWRIKIKFSLQVKYKNLIRNRIVKCKNKRCTLFSYIHCPIHWAIDKQTFDWVCIFDCIFFIIHNVNQTEFMVHILFTIASYPHWNAWEKNTRKVELVLAICWFIQWTKLVRVYSFRYNAYVVKIIFSNQ